MATGFLWDERYMWHDARTFADVLPPELLFEPEPSPESPATKRRFKNLIDASGMATQLHWISPRSATEAEILRLHTPSYVARIRAESAATGGEAGEWTPFGRGSYDIALLAAGGAITAVDAVLDGVVDNVYALVRPPGHHAEPDRGRGYCIFGNTAIAALHARQARAIARVAIVDWDVHHGNGTETAFLNDPTVLAISVHQQNHYPAGRGETADNGASGGAGATVNIPLPAGGGRSAYLDAFERVVVPALERFQPELILVASGLDASAMDPSARMNLTPPCYGVLTRIMMDVARRLCGGRLVFIHEGGYSSMLVPYCGLAVLEELTGHRTGVPLDGLVDGAPHALPLHAHERTKIDAAASLIERVPSP
jgi:acetoin utilization deacetylase AcuC-like enzyme